MFINFTTKNDEQVIVNMDHVVMLCNTKKGPFVVFDDESSFYCKEDFDQVLRKVDRAVVLSNAEFRQLCTLEKK